VDGIKFPSAEWAEIWSGDFWPIEASQTVFSWFGPFSLQY